MSDSTNEYVTRSARLRETGTAFHIKSGRSHFHLCHTFIILCQENFFSPTPSPTPSVSKQHLWHLLDFMYISLSQLSGEERRIMAGREMSDFVMNSVIYNKEFQCKVYKRSLIIKFFFLLPLDSLMMMYGRHYLPAHTWNWHKKPRSTLFLGPFFFFSAKDSMASNGKSCRICVVYCSFSEGIKLQVAHIIAWEKKVNFDIFGFKGEATLLVFLINLFKRLQKATGIGIHGRCTMDEWTDVMEL